MTEDEKAAHIAENIKQAAERAKAEAAARRAQALNTKETPEPKELNGPKGEEPSRFGDWERKGIAYDF